MRISYEWDSEEFKQVNKTLRCLIRAFAQTAEQISSGDQRNELERIRLEALKIEKDMKDQQNELERIRLERLKVQQGTNNHNSDGCSYDDCEHFAD